MREALVENMALAKQQARAALALSNGRAVAAMSAIALGVAGDSAQATRLADDWAKGSRKTRSCSSTICR